MRMACGKRADCTLGVQWIDVTARIFRYQHSLNGLEWYQVTLILLLTNVALLMPEPINF